MNISISRMKPTVNTLRGIREELEARTGTLGRDRTAEE
jgi:hypothetical protein